MYVMAARKGHQHQFLDEPSTTMALKKFFAKMLLNGVSF
jgi:hypothetical protein